MDAYEKRLALALFLEEDIDSIEESSYDDCVFEVGNREYLVCTDEEADQKWDESLDSYIDECILPELPEQYQHYFDNEAFKSDCKTDGRGHSLSGYDGNEDEFHITGGEDFFWEMIAEFHDLEDVDELSDHEDCEKLWDDFLEHYDIYGGHISTETIFIYRQN